MVGKQERVYVLRHMLLPLQNLASILEFTSSLLASHRSAFLTRYHFGDLECEATNFRAQWREGSSIEAGR